MAEHLVYRITHRESGKFYIGITARTVSVRWREHKRGRGQSVLAKAVRKYGPAAFDVQTLAYAADADEARELERYLIARLDPPYNLTDGGEGCWGLERGPCPQHVRDKIAATLRGRKLTPEHRAKLIGRPAHLKGKMMPAETRAKISAAKKGQRITPEQQARKVEKLRAFWRSAEGRELGRQLAQRRWGK